MQRIGLGYDVHAFAPDRPLILGGVHIPYEQGLLGHSDADVVAHALMDAVLGALRAGDIGKLFPDTDSRFLGADSLKLLEQVAELMRAQGYTFVDGDIVVAAEAPKLSPHREAMRSNLARCLGVPMESLGLKATTTEGLGFVGRKEGIACMATVLLEQSSELHS